MKILIILNILIILVELSICQYSRFDNCGQLKDPTKVPKDVKEYKWLTLIKHESSTRHCIGSIIDDKWILTAASCLPKHNEPYNYKVTTPNLPNQQLSVDKIVKNPKYNPTLGAGYDLALVKLRNSLQLKQNNELKPICLAEEDLKLKMTDESVCYILSYEYKNENIDTTPIFTPQLKFKYNKDIDCKQQIIAMFYTDNYNDKYMLCGQIQSLDTTKTILPAAPYGNNGAPIVCENNGKLYLMAITSWGWTEKQQKDIYKNQLKCDAYTKLFDKTYINWIIKTLNVLED